jgi:hypothetical protein
MFSKKISRTTIKVQFLSYENISLRLYLELSSSADYSRLIVKGKADVKGCAEQWEKIVKLNNQANGSFQYTAYFETQQDLALLIADYNVIKASLFVLLFETDNDIIEHLKEKGYVIDTSSQDKYNESIEAATRRSNNLITKIQSKQNELALQSGEEGGQPVGFEEIMANMIAALGQHVPDDVTLARYNQYRKIIQTRIDKGKKKNNTDNG